MPPNPQGNHGELTELSVTGGQELAAAAAETAELDRSSASIGSTSILHGAGAACMEIAVSLSATFAAVGAGARPAPPPVSNTFVSPSDIRVKVNLGQTFRVESIVLEFIFIVPVEALN